MKYLIFVTFLVVSLAFGLLSPKIEAYFGFVFGAIIYFFGSIAIGLIWSATEKVLTNK